MSEGIVLFAEEVLDILFLISCIEVSIVSMTTGDIDALNP